MGHFLNAKAVLQQTDSDSSIYSIGDTLFRHNEKHLHSCTVQNQHIHIVSNDIPRAGDSVYNLKSDKTYTITIPEEVVEYEKVILATTDDTLFTRTTTEIEGNQSIQLPKPSQIFIEDFINAYNNCIHVEDVLIELNAPCCKCDTFEKALSCTYSGYVDECHVPNPNSDFYGLFPKINTDNTINVTIKNATC